LVPLAGSDVAGPARLELRQIVRHFLDFRYEVVTKRLRFDLNEILKRIHLLEGLEKIFDALDETIRIIRRSEGKQDAADKLMKRFDLDAEQTDAILELKLYRLAQLEIEIIRKELKEKRHEADRLQALLGSEKARWKLIRAELLEIRNEYADPRRTVINAKMQEPEYDAEAFIVEEDAYVLLTQQGWIKRQRELKDVETTRVREGDRVLDVAVGSTKSAVALFSNQGSCYVCRVADILPSTGYGDPVQKLFKLADGERIIRMLGFDPRMLSVPPPDEAATEPEEPYAVAVTRAGMTLRFSLRAHREPSTRTGRRYLRPEEGDEAIYLALCGPDSKIACASVTGRALICETDEVSLLAGPGKGVRLIKLDDGDQLVGARVLANPDDALVVERESGTELSITLRKHEVVSRAGRGYHLFKRGSLKRALIPPPSVPQLPESE
jgi:DNA gyrase subunit A